MCSQKLWQTLNWFKLHTSAYLELFCANIRTKQYLDAEHVNLNPVLKVQIFQNQKLKINKKLGLSFDKFRLLFAQATSTGSSYVLLERSLKINIQLC